MVKHIPAGFAGIITLFGRFEKIVRKGGHLILPFREMFLVDLGETELIQNFEAESSLKEMLSFRANVKYRPQDESDSTIKAIGYTFRWLSREDFDHALKKQIVFLSKEKIAGISRHQAIYNNYDLVSSIQPNLSLSAELHFKITNFELEVID